MFAGQINACRHINYYVLSDWSFDWHSAIDNILYSLTVTANTAVFKTDDFTLEGLKFSKLT